MQNKADHFEKMGEQRRDPPRGHKSQASVGGYNRVMGENHGG